MNPVIARPPEAVTELCLIRLGIQVRSLSAFWYARRLRGQIQAAADAAIAAQAGLLHSDFFAINRKHFGVWQYWQSYDALETWSHQSPHSDWWREATNRMRSRGDFGIYHETFLVPAEQIEAIYLDCQPAGLATFGLIGKPAGPDANSRGRLRRKSI